MTRARRAVACLLTVAVCGGSVAACGGSGDKAPTGAAAILKDTFGPGKPVRSGRLDVAVRFDSTGLPGVTGPVGLTLKGPFQSQGTGSLPQFDFDAGLSAGGTSFTAGAVSAPGRGYLQLQGASYALPAAIYTQFKSGYEASVKAASSGEKKGSGTSLGALGIDPVRWLKSPKTVGDEVVGGAKTNHVSATVDVPKLLEDVDTLLRKAGAAGAAGAGVPDGLTTIQKTGIQEAIQSATFDVWAGKDDGVLRKLDIQIAFDVPAIARSAAGGLKSGKLGLTLTIADLGKRQTIAAPKTVRPFAELQNALGQLVGGLTGAGGTGSGSAGGAAAPSTGGSATPGAGTGTGTTGSSGAPGQSAYDACMAAAGADIAKVNECAPLLNK